MEWSESEGKQTEWSESESKQLDRVKWKQGQTVRQCEVKARANSYNRQSVVKDSDGYMKAVTL